MRLNLIQFLSNASFFTSLIFIPLFAAEVGASPWEIGVIGAVYSISVFFSSYIAGKASDRFSERLVMRVGLLLSSVSFLLQILADSPLSLALVRALAGFCVGIYPPALLSYVYWQRRNIGKFISYSSLGWAFGSFFAGLLAAFQSIFLASSLLFAISFLLTLGLPEPHTEHVHSGFFSLKPLWDNWRVYLSFLSRHTGASAVWIIYPIYLENLGATRFWVGLIYTTNLLGQFFLMQRLTGIPCTRMIRWGYLLSAIAFLFLGLIPSYWWAFPGMLLIACSWSFIYVGSNSLLLELNLEKATAVGLLNSTISMASVIGSLVGGVTAGAFSYRAVFLLASFLALVSLVTFKSQGKCTVN